MRQHPPCSDPLSDVLRSVPLRGAVFFKVSYRDEDWVSMAPPAQALADAVLPGAEHVMAYHLLARGTGWAATRGLPPQRLQAGDIVMFPQGDGHVIGSAPAAPPQEPPDASWVRALPDGPLPIPLVYHRGALLPGSAAALAEAPTVMVCGFIGCELRPFNPLVAALPRMLHLPAGSIAPWVLPVLHHAVAESRQAIAGSAALLERASQMIFVDAARRALQTLPAGSGGWLAALRDPQLGRVLALLHGAPAEPWTVDELGRRAGLSRSALHERFVALAGQPPMQYLAQWRMQCGARLLRETAAPVAAVALDVGYDSEAAFSRAFKRATGLPPAAWRRAQRGAGAERLAA